GNTASFQRTVFGAGPNPDGVFLNYNLFNNPYQQPSCCIHTGIADLLEMYISQMKQELENDEDCGKALILKNYLQSFFVQIPPRKNEFEKNLDHQLPILDEKRI